MFNSPVLDLVILLSFTYFIGSLILSTVNEAIAGTLRLRQNDLKKALEKLFFDPQWRSFLKTNLLKSPHIQSLMKKPNQVPAYIPARNFILALIDNVKKESLDSNDLESEVDDNSKKEIIPQDILKIMKAHWLQARLSATPGKMEEFEKRMEEFYNNAMDRTTGRYKKKIRRLLLVLGFILAAVLNIDTIKIVNDSLKDPAKLSKSVDNISAQIRKISLNNDSVVIHDSLGTIYYTASGSAKVLNDSSAYNIEKLIKNGEKLKVFYEQETGYSLGYKGSPMDEWSNNFFLKLLGILITAFALQLGSNYWFDLMNKAVNIRASGKKPDEKPPIAK